jgi:transposase
LLGDYVSPLLTVWFDPEMCWDASPTGRRGRQQTYSDAAVQTCLTMKVLFGMALRQATGFVESLLKLVGLDWRVPDFSTLSRRQKTLAVNIPYRGSGGPLHLLVDSTGIKVEGEGEWNARKHGGSKRRVWRKIHLGIDERTLEVRAVEVTGSHIGDAPVLPDLLGQIPPGEEIGSVTADGAYDTRKCHDAIADRGAHAVIPPRRNAKPWKPTTAGAMARNAALRSSKYLGRAIWRNWSGYHRRSRAETKMHCMKLLGQRLMARDFDRQVAEVQVRIAIMNGYTALGIPATRAVG